MYTSFVYKPGSAYAKRASRWLPPHEAFLGCKGASSDSVRNDTIKAIRPRAGVHQSLDLASVGRTPLTLDCGGRPRRARASVPSWADERR